MPKKDCIICGGSGIIDPDHALDDMLSRAHRYVADMRREDPEDKDLILACLCTMVDQAPADVVE